MNSRYAIYFAPGEGSNLWRFGTSWLGRDPASGAAPARPPVSGLAPEFVAAATESPRHYGFHATLKPPFALAEGTYAAHLVHALDAFAAQQQPFAVRGLELTRFGSFLAFGMMPPDARMAALAEGCVRGFDRFRAPPDAAELAKRRHAGLNARQEELLLKWGYPYVFDEFRFHMSLTGRLDGDQLDRVEEALRPHVAPFRAAPLPVDSVCLFWQKDRTAPFSLIRRCRFGEGDDRPAPR
jgi:putative phosphonate metabolism protein